MTLSMRSPRFSRVLDDRLLHAVEYAFLFRLVQAAKEGLNHAKRQSFAALCPL